MVVITLLSSSEDFRSIATYSKYTVDSVNLLNAFFPNLTQFVFFKNLVEMLVAKLLLLDKHQIQEKYMFQNEQKCKQYYTIANSYVPIQCKRTVKFLHSSKNAATENTYFSKSLRNLFRSSILPMRSIGYKPETSAWRKNIRDLPRHAGR